jgi:hypothetical protein
VTAMTLPDAELNADLRPWLEGEIEKPCEFVIRDTNEPCGDRANWLMYGRKTCAHAPLAIARFACDACRSAVADGRCSCAGDLCPAVVNATWVERIRKRRRWWSR